MNSASFSASLSASLLALALLGPGSALAQSDPAAEGRAAAALGEFQEAATLYQAAAKASSGDDASDYTLLAAEALLNARMPAEAEALLKRLPPASLNATRTQLASIYRARAKLAQNDPASALRALPSAPDSPHAAAALSVRADALFLLDDAAGGTTARVLREQMLAEPEQQSNRELLWRSLRSAKLPTSLPNSVEPMVRGWIELASLSRSLATVEQVEEWVARNSRHPASLRLHGPQLASAIERGQLFELVLANFQPAPTEVAAAAGGADSVGGFALLLPLSGPLANAAQAVRAGAIAAMNQAGATAPLLQIHDSTAGMGNVLAAAIARDAEVVIGPLKKEDVSQLGELGPSLPVVALNYPDKPMPANMLPFGLAPEDEARSAATEALAANLRGALVLSLEGDWGARAAAAFRETFTAGGGAVVSEGQLKAGLNDYGPSIKPLLGIADAEARNKELAGLGIAAELEAQPRGDVDVIFLALRGKQARLVVPQLRYYNGGALPVFALAATSDSGTNELANVRICDVPWRQENLALAPLREQLASINPRAPDTQRLFALGFDAYQLALQQRSQGGVAEGSRMPGALSGTLVVQQGAARRQLLCLPAKAVNAEEGEPAKPAPVKPAISAVAAPATASKPLPPGAAAKPAAKPAAAPAKPAAKPATTPPSP